MKIIRDSITSLTERGYLTLQVPDCEILIDHDPSPTEEVPDEWLVYLKNDRPCHSKEVGVLFLTRKGYEANKDKLKAALERAIANNMDRTNGWEAFEREAEIHFQKVEANILKHRRDLQKKLDETKTWRA